MTTSSSIRSALSRHLLAEVDGASVVAFRVLFGLIATIGAFRFIYYDWIEQAFGQPLFFFRYHGFGWLPTPDVTQLYVLFGTMALLGLVIASGRFFRVACAAYLLIFTYVELIDVTNYLNHYYLVSVLTLWLLALPQPKDGTVPRWSLYALRLQVTCVYVYAAIAKATPDWLMHGQPLAIWLASRTSVPLVGAAIDTFGLHGLAMFASWAGFLHDLLIVPALLYRRTRWLAYGALLVFHFATHLLFNIGMFPLIMSAAATVFLPPSWPRRLMRKPARESDRIGRAPARGFAIALVLLAASQVLLPLRAFAYAENVLWHEQGMRFSWRVMCREKNGSVRYRVRPPGATRTFVVTPSRYLTSYQEREMAGQPDLILQLAHRIGEDYRENGEDPEVFVDALVSLNGRAPIPMIDPNVNLMGIEDGFARANWITAPPDDPPARLER